MGTVRARTKTVGQCRANSAGMFACRPFRAAQAGFGCGESFSNVTWSLIRSRVRCVGSASESGGASCRRSSLRRPHLHWCTVRRGRHPSEITMCCRTVTSYARLSNLGCGPRTRSPTVSSRLGRIRCHRAGRAPGRRRIASPTSHA